MKINKLLIIGLSAFLIAFIIGFSYFTYYTFHKEGKFVNTLEISFSDDDKKIDQAGLAPMSDEKGKLLTPYKFKISNPNSVSSKYQVIIEDSTPRNEDTYQESQLLKRNQLRYQLILNNQVIALDNLGNVKNNVLDIRSIDEEKDNSYELRLWVDKNQTESNWMNKYYHYNIRIKPIN